MRNLTFTTVLAAAALAAGCASHQTRISSAAGEVSPELLPATTSSAVTISTITDFNVSEAYSDPTMDVSERVRILDARATAIDGQPVGGTDLVAGLTPLKYTNVMLSDNAFSDVTDEQWASMETWYEGTDLKKVRLVPGLDRDDTEEFYYDQGKLIMVYWNPNGVGAEDDFNAPGSESFYFGGEGLISWVHQDGTRADPASADFKYWDGQLRAEASRFPGGGQHR